MDIIQKQDRGTLTEVKKRLNPKQEKKDVNAEKELNLLSISSLKKPDVKKKSESKKLKRKLLEVAEQNHSLAKAINDKNHEIADLKRSVQSLNEVLNSVPIDELRCNSSIAGSKILELSKKNRQLRAELETTKNRVNKKDVQIQKLEKEMKAIDEKYRQFADIRKGNATPLEELQSKLNALQQKLFESRNKNVELQNQLKLAQKCLQQEVGENFNLNLLAASSAQSAWRGRAQQIIHLQQKMQELKERLEVYEQQRPERIANNFSYNGTNESSNSEISTPPSAVVILTGPRPSTSERFTPGVRKSEILHRAKVDSLEKEISSLKMQLEDHRAKILALKVRNKTLNDEVFKYKMKTSTLKEQTDYNGTNLTSITEKMNIQKCQFENLIEEINREMEDVKRQRETAEFKEAEMRTKLDNMEELLSRKNVVIEELNEKIQLLETDMKALCGDFLFSCRELRKEEFIALLDSLEAEKNLLLEHNKTLNARIDQERSKNESLSEQLSKQKIRICRMEAKIRDLEKELDVQNEKKKRSQRISEYAQSVSSMSLSSFVFENSSVNGTSNPSAGKEKLSPEIEDLKNQLEFSSEKITLLEEKIAHLSEEKKNDSKAFEELLLNSKQIILNTILEQSTSFRENMDINISQCNE